jgi:VWFA-related protein
MPTNRSTPPLPSEHWSEVGENDVIRVDTTLVTIPVSVMDREGRYIPNLNKDDFRLWEDGVEQKIGFFQSVDKPFSVVLMIDTSGSTRFRLEEIQDAAITFVNQLRSDDRVMVISFDDKLHLLSDFTSDRNQMRSAIQRTHPGAGTALYDAVDVVVVRSWTRFKVAKRLFCSRMGSMQ